MRVCWVVYFFWILRALWAALHRPVFYCQDFCQRRLETCLFNFTGNDAGGLRPFAGRPHFWSRALQYWVSSVAFVLGDGCLYCGIVFPENSMGERWVVVSHGDGLARLFVVRFFRDFADWCEKCTFLLSETYGRGVTIGILFRKGRSSSALTIPAAAPQFYSSLNHELSIRRLVAMIPSPKLNRTSCPIIGWVHPSIQELLKADFGWLIYQ